MMKNNKSFDEVYGATRAVIFGHAVADALGVPVEFNSRASLMRDPVLNMREYGTYHMPRGSWSDDTSMTLAALAALSGGELDFDAVMHNFWLWYSEGSFTPAGKLFDIGGTSAEAIMNYGVRGLTPTACGLCAPNSNGNGSLMRILPFVLFAKYSGYSGNVAELIRAASSLTHAHERSVVGCGIYTEIVLALLDAPEPSSVSLGIKRAHDIYKTSSEFAAYSRIFDKNFPLLEEKDIKSSGYVVDTLEAAIWCILTTNDYKSCVLKAVNLGEDTDTVAAVAGGLAGALYGYGAIPREWVEQLLKNDYVDRLCADAARGFLARSRKNSENK